ncbi:MAG: LysR substrate-binding domain-containing protein [Pseudorhodobacter sp.]
MALDLRRLRYLQAIAQNGSLTRAAETLGVAQPALSHHLAELEGHFGTTLFHRGSRGMVPTEVGRILAAHASSILRSVEDAEAATRAAADTLAGSVTLGLLNTLALSLTVPMLQRCSERYPNIKLSIWEGTSQNLHEGIQKQELDLAINLFEASELPARMLAIEELVLVGSPEMDPSRAEIPLREALERPLILPPKEHVIRKLVEWAAIQQDIRLNVRYELSGGVTLKSAVIAGFGYTILGRSALSREDLATNLSFRRIVSPQLERRLVTAHCALRSASPVVKTVTALLQELVTDLAGEETWTMA